MGIAKRLVLTGKERINTPLFVVSQLGVTAVETYYETERRLILLPSELLKFGDFITLERKQTLFLSMVFILH